MKILANMKRSLNYPKKKCSQKWIKLLKTYIDKKKNHKKSQKSLLQKYIKSTYKKSAYKQKIYSLSNQETKNNL